MSDFLPATARAYIDENDKLVSIQRLTAAVTSGDVDITVLKTYVDATAAGRVVKFQQTKPVSLLILEDIRAHPNEEPRRVVYRGLNEKRWTYEDVEQWETNNSVLSNARKTSVSRSIYLTRKRRVRRVLPKVSDQFVPKMAMDVVCHRDLPDGAKACLAVLLGLAGKKDEIITFTSSIATMLGRTARTVRNYFIALEECGLIERKAGSSPNTVHIKIKPLVKPEPYQEPKDITAYRLARKSSNAALREMAETVAAFSWSLHQAAASLVEGRKVISAFNLSSNSKEETVLVSRSGPTTYSTFRPQMRSDKNHWNPHRPSQSNISDDEAPPSRGLSRSSSPAHCVAHSSA
jgi:predicted transcriptional regulator